MDAPPLVSVVLPTYNGKGKYLVESVESVLAQELLEFELIIVDDASEDGARRLVEELAQRDARIRVIRNQSNCGLPRSLNCGFSSARGRFLTWTSDDNRYRPNALKVMCDALLHNPDVGLVYAGYSDVDEAGRHCGGPHFIPVDGMLSANVVRCCFMYTRSAAELVGSYDADLFLAEDYDYWLRLLAAGVGVLQLREDLYEYRRHPGSLTSQRRSAIVRARLLARRKSVMQVQVDDCQLKVDALWRSWREARDVDDAELASWFRRRALVLRLLGRVRTIAGGVARLFPRGQ